MVSSSFLKLFVGAGHFSFLLHPTYARSIGDVPAMRSLAERIGSSRIPFSRRDASQSAFNFLNLNGLSGGRNEYTANVTIGGQSFEVQLDTGSSDLWVDTTGLDLTSFTNTGFSTGILYGDGTGAQGPILIGNITFGEFTFKQAFISAPGSNATLDGDLGLLGLGPPTLSQISETLAESGFNGATVMENLFASSTSTSPFMTFQLSRSEITGGTSGGVFTIGEIDSTFSAITSTAPLPVVETGPEDQWTILMDGIVVDGQKFSGHTENVVAGQEPGQTVALIDSGTALASIPQFYLDAIYANVPGAELTSDGSEYIVPCDSQIQLSFVFAGVEYPIDPIDTVIAQLDEDANIVCTSGFVNIDTVEGGQEGQDLILGDTFMRNVYALFDFGEFVENSNMAPFVQLLSTTDLTNASAQFSNLSSQRNSTLMSAMNNSTMSGTGTSAPGSAGNSSSGGMNNSTQGNTDAASNSAYATHIPSLWFVWGLSSFLFGLF